MHHCNKSGGGVTWSLCSACRGRIHDSGCTSKRNADLDCCEARHHKLWALGELIGLDDASLPMYDHDHITWAPG